VSRLPVGQDARRIVRQGTCHGDPLPLSAWQLIGGLVTVIAEP